MKSFTEWARANKDLALGYEDESDELVRFVWVGHETILSVGYARQDSEFLRGYCGGGT